MAARADAPPGAGSALLELVRCPRCDGKVAAEGDRARCTAGHAFPVVDGVLVLVDDEALAADPQYDHQRRFFAAEFERYGSYAPERWRVSYLQRLRTAGLVGEGASPLVDVGVGGSGHTVIEAARLGAAAIGCDLSLEALVRARRFAAAEGVLERTLWVCCSAERLPFADASAASVLAIAVLEHVPDDGAALAEAARILRPGGRLWVTVPHALRHVAPILRPANRRHDRRLGHLRRYDAAGLVDAGRRVGLVPDEIRRTGHPVKVLQLAGDRLLRGRVAERLWWWCERRDLARSHEARGSMQLSAVFTR